MFTQHDLPETGAPGAHHAVTPAARIADGRDTGDDSPTQPYASSP
ncbi:hypothetical protein [Planobispora longispora]|uniref:Uncharacterized protein n=1 Tax=Planobispora longispora TaxID=28887 RepID=A0A8J3W843_9ACTN|nr:hypothetical protein [Planobispora longispora]BFE80651.1 hypothetical protein GCM10020093_032520 [Planobispora longispora]GIH79293.1 hypothetical protein Plo01_57220 [Planobispora longispora]